jgi:hypothetical protein
MLRAPIVPSPLDEPTIRAKGDDPDLVLIVGNGTAHGWGVTTHQLALPGQLARELQRTSGRPCSVHYIGDDRMSIADALDRMADHDLSIYDVVIVIFGVSDAIQLTPEKRWDRDLRELLDGLGARSKFSAQFLLCGIQPLRSIITLDSALGGIADVHAERLNRITQSIAAGSDDTVYYPLTAAKFEEGKPFGSASLYRARAVEIGEEVRPMIEAVRLMEGDARVPTNLA